MSKKYDIFIIGGGIIGAGIARDAAGPWINEIMSKFIKIKSKKSIRLEKGSHIIIKKLYDPEVAITLQNNDKRIIFVIPYKENIL